MRTIRASEIAAYLYCRRAWWYSLQGIPPENQAELAGGQALHARHGREVVISNCQRVLAYILLALALVLLTIYLTTLVLS